MNWQSEYLRLAHHREILTGKMALPSNVATQAALAVHVARIDGQLRKLMARELADLGADPWREELALRHARSKDRERLRAAQGAGHDEYADFLAGRIEDENERIRECREEQDAGIDGEPKPASKRARVAAAAGGAA